ncbi:JAB domain-containing protein [Gallintestinimicrobium sp.]|uniref:JAB domain-containing protein n=1 Tax=Gallintestinimicrobium sp. TaxID=2981655 RepID=UPI0039956B2F
MRRSFLRAKFFCRRCAVGAVSFLLLHNHPSGDVTPSPEDKELTKRLAMLGGMMQLCLTDHIIVGDSDFFSFRQAGLI